MAAPASTKSLIEELLAPLDQVPDPKFFHHRKMHRELAGHWVQDGEFGIRPLTFEEREEKAESLWNGWAQFAKKDFIQQHKREVRKKKLEILANCGGDDEFIKLLKDAMFTYKHPSDLL